MKFKAALLTELNQPFTIAELELDLMGGRGVGFGQALVQVHCSGICGSQLSEQAGTRGPDRNLPHTAGHEGCGTVVEVGLGVGFVHKGDKVVMHWRKGSGIEARHPSYQWRNGDGIRKSVGGGLVTTFNEYALVSENRLTKIDKSIPNEIAALCGCAVTTGLGLVNNDAKLKIGQSIAVVGCGGVGLNVLQGAYLVGGNPIIGIDIQESKFALAKEFGATHTVQTIEQARELVGDRGLDVVVETTGKVELIEKAYDLTSKCGKTILVGQMRWDQKASIQTLPMHAGKTILGSDGGCTDPNVDIPRYLRLYQSGRLKLDNLITHRFKLDEVNKAIDMIKAGLVGRAILEME